VLTNVRVLAVDQTANEDEAGTALVAKTATLELDMRQVEIVTAAESSGTLSLALRSAEDNDEEPTVSEAIDSGNRKKGVVRMIRSGRTELVEIPGSG
jgi:pilus assembly protein CpaB